MNSAQPLAQFLLRLGLRWRVFQLLLQVLRAYVARIKFGKSMKEAVHVSLLSVARLVWVVCRHGVQEGPGLRTQLILVQRTILSDVIVIAIAPGARRLVLLLLASLIQGAICKIYSASASATRANCQ